MLKNLFITIRLPLREYQGWKRNLSGLFENAGMQCVLGHELIQEHEKANRLAKEGSSYEHVGPKSKCWIAYRSIKSTIKNWVIHMLIWSLSFTKNGGTATERKQSKESSASSYRRLLNKHLHEIIMEDYTYSACSENEEDSQYVLGDYLTLGTTSFWNAKQSSLTSWSLPKTQRRWSKPNKASTTHLWKNNSNNTLSANIFKKG